MARTLRLKRFSNAAVLKRVNPILLFRFLDPYKEFLAVKRGLPWPDRAEELDFVALAGILMSPGVDTPDDLLDALYFVDNLADSDCYERILEEAHEAGIDLGAMDPSPEDLVLHVWLTDPDIIQRVHAEQYRTRPKTFKSFFAAGRTHVDLMFPSDTVRLALEADLDEWFDFRKKGRGARVFPFPREDGFWFLVRHGQRIKREGTVEADGDSGSVFYRPEKFDVLIYYPATGEVAIYAETKGEQEVYCQLFGKHLFGNEAFFLFGSPIPKYTLQPLIDLGRQALACTDVEGMLKVELHELQYAHESDRLNKRTVWGDDVFAELEANGPELSESGLTLVKAKFRVTFVGGRQRIVSIEPPNTASFDRETDNSLVHEWMLKRGFVPASNTEGAAGGAVLEVA